MFQPIYHPDTPTPPRAPSEYTAPRFSTLIILNPPSPAFAAPAAASVTPPAGEALAEVDEEGVASSDRDHCPFCRGCSSDACPRDPDARDEAAEAAEVVKVLVAMRYGGRWFEERPGQEAEEDNDDAVHGACSRLPSPLSSLVPSPPPPSGGRGKKGAKRGKSTAPLSKKRKREERDESPSRGSGSSKADAGSGPQSGAGGGEKERAAASPLKRSIESDDAVVQPKKKKFRIIFKKRSPPDAEAKKTDGSGDDAAPAPPSVPAPVTAPASEESSTKERSGHEEVKDVDVDKEETVTAQTYAATEEEPRTTPPAPKAPLRRSGLIIRINCRRAR